MFSVINNEWQRNKLELFYKENLDCFLNIALSNLHNGSDAEDAVQQAFSDIADKPEKFFSIPRSKRVNYVFTIVRNISIDMFNKRNRILTEKLGDESPLDSISLEDAVIGRIAEDRLKEFISGLPPLQKNVLMLRCMHGLSIADTAQALNISQSAVKERLRLARKAIKDFIDREEG